MVNLTPEQITLLKWMRTGRTFQVCSDYCSHNGDVQPKSRLPIQVHHKAIHKLMKEGAYPLYLTTVFRFALGCLLYHRKREGHSMSTLDLSCIDRDDRAFVQQRLLPLCAEHGVDLGGESPLRAQSSENR
ncbi:hypothetical protein [Vibrio navarrensis]|uniref:hypothetical protein n=1 Tax=Vibrio navarrensis TaxID=29495 RepID=UPI0020953794|nr:hypothetical protein [Vibrio navarrensis]